MSSIMDKNNVMYAGFSTLPTLSLCVFEGCKEVHGAVQWLLKAYEDYRNRVSNRKMGYKAFLEENLVKLSMPIILDESSTYADLQQEVIDRDKVKHILENRKFTEEHFNTETFEEANAIRMISIYNAIGVEETVIKTKGILPLRTILKRPKLNLPRSFVIMTCCVPPSLQKTLCDF